MTITIVVPVAVVVLAVVLTFVAFVLAVCFFVNGD
jgi:hypothetical protein